MKRSIEEKVMLCGTCDTRTYRYVLRDDIACMVIVRIRREYLGRSEALNPVNWVIVKEV